MAVRKRKKLPLRWVKRLLKQQDGKCAVAKCGVVLTLTPRNYIDEHVVPLALGGTNQLKNRELRCAAHAKSKTYGSKATTAGSDIGNIAKMRRIRNGKMRVMRKPRLSVAEELAASRQQVVRFIANKLRGRPFSKRRRPMRKGHEP